MRILQPHLHRGHIAEAVAVTLALMLLSILGAALVQGLSSLR
jgi:hypothetical protein